MYLQNSKDFSFLSLHVSYVYMCSLHFLMVIMKYIYIFWGFPAGHFLNNSFTSARRKKDSLFPFLQGHMCSSLQLFFLSPPTSDASLFFSYVNLGKRRGLEILPLPLLGSLSTLASTRDNVIS